ncbi:osmotin-like protein [Impatiens glandulifera]|uniref:osmotin-like protein n=1 Tax=Impatiens glandulifera TaxID=253017 RepID=UPI001FB13048|nr:osmotin-like protein [Impatiens glandulifera]
MASTSSIFSFFLLFASLNLAYCTSDLILTIVNNCPYPIWPAIQPNHGHPVLQNGGFHLDKLSHRSFPAPQTQWSGRIWARTNCISSYANHLTCATGECGGRLECAGAGGATPATLAQINIHHGNADFSSYGVSLVDGFNIPMTVTPHEGKGKCPVVGCKENLLATCPDPLKLHSKSGGVVGCKSGCEAFNTDKLCCRNSFSSQQNCQPSNYSDFFKKACPATFTYAHDSPSLSHECSSPRELKVIFCH